MSTLSYDPEQSKALAQEDNHQRLMAWLKKGGVLFNKVEFPATFTLPGSKEGINGVVCKERIEARELIMSIPNRLLISSEKAKQSELGEVYNNHQDLFVANPNREILILILFIMYQRALGPDSFWADYFVGNQLVNIPPLWEEEIVQKLADRELREKIKESRSLMLKDWEALQPVIRMYEGQHFPERMSSDFEAYKYAYTTVVTRSFGWGFPYMFLSPGIDLVNHTSEGPTHMEFLHTKLHLADNQVYMHKHDFDEVESWENEPHKKFEKESHRMQMDVRPLYEHLGLTSMEGYNEAVLRGEAPDESEHYNEEEVFKRFRTLFDFENSKACLKVKMQLMEKGIVSEESYEEAKREYLKANGFSDSGIQIWGIGIPKDMAPGSSKMYDEEDNDAEDLEQDEEEARRAVEIQQKIMSDDIQEFNSLDQDDLETISESPVLIPCYNNPWYRVENRDTYFALCNGSKPIEAGEQVFLSYGERGNGYLFENYGFTLDESNKFASFEFRVIMGTNPKEKLASAAALLPEQKLLDDKENIDITTEVIRLKAHRISYDLLAYLRSVLMNKNYEGEDSKFIMVSSPRVLDFEVIVVEWAIELIQAFCDHPANLKHFQTSIEEDEHLLKTLGKQGAKFENDVLILRYNIQMKRIKERSLKAFKVLKAILLLIRDEKEPFTSACFKRIPGLEDADEERTIFKTRAGMSQYFKDLKMNLLRVQKQKNNYSDKEIHSAMKSAKKAKEPKPVASAAKQAKPADKSTAKPATKVVGKAAIKKGTTSGGAQKRGDSRGAQKRGDSTAKKAPAVKRANSKVKK